jgi:hypothetical protein
MENLLPLQDSGRPGIQKMTRIIFINSVLSISDLQFASFSDISLKHRISLSERTIRSVAKLKRVAKAVISYYYGITKKIMCLISVVDLN